MSDQEPFDKSMISRLREYAKPYQPDAWEDFEKFRAEKKRKRRPLIYWLSVAAGLVLIVGIGFGTKKILKNSISNEGAAIARKVISSESGTDTVLKKPVRKPVETGASLPNRSTSESGKAAVTSKHHSENFNLTKSNLFPQKSQEEIPSHLTENDRNPAHSPTVGDHETKRTHADLAFLPPQPAAFYTVNFRKLYIARLSQEVETAVTARIIRYGIGLSQQSNQAAETQLKLNYALGGTMDIPVGAGMDLSTGIYVGRQSLNIKPDIVPVAGGIPQLQEVHHRWLNTEIPLHLRYTLKNFKTFGIVATGGFTVLGSVGQTSDYIYKNQRTITTVMETEGGPVVVSTQTVEDISSVNDQAKKEKWSFGAALHLGLGMYYPLQNNQLALEPFFRYPMGAVTADKLRFTSFGVQLRWSGALKKTHH